MKKTTIIMIDEETIEKIKRIHDTIKNEEDFETGLSDDYTTMRGSELPSAPPRSPSGEHFQYHPPSVTSTDTKITKIFPWNSESFLSDDFVDPDREEIFDGKYEDKAGINYRDGGSPRDYKRGYLDAINDINQKLKDQHIRFIPNVSTKKNRIKVKIQYLDTPSTSTQVSPGKELKQYTKEPKKLYNKKEFIKKLKTGLQINKDGTSKYLNIFDLNIDKFNSLDNTSKSLYEWIDLCVKK